ncbi:hypothetical protein [Raineyella fluvialis]|uniref:Uncharacterized protein n=1 Tax=Raineyella fluvialis TaxID=2662261 RepID=A0A5Q2FBV4_9ACTN|nr:hypothetical protein [Raineyella fluvialis]QGF24372.1 hypothetical protein Rai3103_12670 [Raineyella fluvialis]
MRWRRQALPVEVRRAAVAMVPDDGPDRTRLLAWGRDGDRYVIGFPGHLVYDDGNGWHALAWHRILRGGWDKDTQRLSWVDYDGGRGDLALEEPGSMPELFKERVEASIMVRRQVVVPGTKHGVMVVGRRVLGAEPPVFEWHASVNKGTRWSDPGAREAAEAALAELRSEYDPYGGR